MRRGQNLTLDSSASNAVYLKFPEIPYVSNVLRHVTDDECRGQGINLPQCKTAFFNKRFRHIKSQSCFIRTIPELHQLYKVLYFA
ncbi:hypothetical protein AVEN_274339-1 [Araneus ventricosus]|uniref:Uncharacterized protein n=1 Tax=Araneus ventricosus TaxID=182803 RepID=A0A4Y2SF87_ARAVE|nr:hypothetical protein AVEN_7433-1 [Araneus ventricosus]GBN86817.1 hypothetical protein AVEN_274339-1 [Araneus ventricosus]